MNRTSFALSTKVLLALLLAACSSPADEREAGDSPAPLPPAESSPTIAAPSPQIRVWGGFAVSIPYGSFGAWVRDAVDQGGGVALVRVVEVSPVRWSTASGEGPGPADIARYNRAEADFSIGRLVTVELVRMLRGTGPAVGATALYWLPGGRIGNDLTTAYSGDERLNQPLPGALAVAGTFAGIDMDGTDGTLFVEVQRLFPADPSGRIRTYSPDEAISVNEIDRYLPAP